MKPSLQSAGLALLLAAAAALQPLAADAAPRPPVSADSAAAAAHASRAFWLDARGVPAATSAAGMPAAVKASRVRTAHLDRTSLAGHLAGAPMEFAPAAQRGGLVLALPSPDGGFQRFEIVESPVMEPGLAALHPDIKTYAGRGLDDPAARIRLDLTPLGLHASVRSARSGTWYIDPHYRLEQGLYSSYYVRHLPAPAARRPDALLSTAQLTLTTSQFHAADTVPLSGMGFAPLAPVTVTVRSAGDGVARQSVQVTASPEGAVSLALKADPYKTPGDYTVTASDGSSVATVGYRVVADALPVAATVGPVLKTYRLALVTDPSYATYFGGSAFVTAAKVTLVNRVTQMYELDTAIRLLLVNDNDKLNLDTAALASGADGPYGGTACFTPAQLASCDPGTGLLSRNTAVIGLLVGAGNYDVGHIALGVDGGGVAQLGVVGLADKGAGCTGLPTPTGDFFAIDYVAHEMGHQFAANHTFNGTLTNCSGGNRNAATSVEPGSGSSIMAYAGICSSDNLQAHSDPYWSFQSFEEVVAHTSAAEQVLDEVQVAALRGFSAKGGQLFQVRLRGADSVTIGNGGERGYTAGGIKAAIQGIPGWPAGATVHVSAVSDSGFTVTFGGALAGVDAPALQLVNFTGGASGFMRDTVKGGLTTRQGSRSATGNRAPVVTVPAARYTVPLRTPFALTGSAIDPDGDGVTYLWEQTDRGAKAGTALVSNGKTNGPLFRQFGTRALVGAADTLQYDSPGENHADANPVRVFPDLEQIIADNTNALTGACTLAGTAPTPAETDCFSEYLPTASYAGTAGVNGEPSLNFRLTARDGRGGIGHASVQLLLAANAGPFRITSHAAPAVLDGGSLQTLTWNVANTQLAPVGVSRVRISLSLDGGRTYPHVLAAGVPNDGARAVTLPNVATTQARFKVEAEGNVFFDISHADLTIRRVGGS